MSFTLFFFKKMPPKKKRCPPHPKLALDNSTYLDNYSQLPTDGDFLNGHILYFYSGRCGSSWAKTVQEILSLLPTDSSTPDSCRSASLLAAVKRIVSRTLHKFHKLTNEIQFCAFADICKEQFSLKLRQVYDTTFRPILATLCFLSSKLRAQKNRTVAYLDNMTEEKRDVILKKAVKLGHLQRKKKKAKQKDLMKEMAKRQADNQQVRETTECNKLQKKLKNISIEELAKNFPDLDSEKLEQVTNLITGKSVGHHICHLWYEENEQVMYHGKIESLK